MKIIEFGSEFDWDSNLPFVAKGSAPYFTEDGLTKYRSGRDALKAVAQAYQHQTKTVLLPALCCESMVSPFVLNGYTPIFYKMESDYTANVADVEKKLEKNCLFLYMSYFGVVPFTGKQLKLWKEKYHCVFIEDKTQNALHETGSKDYAPDVTVTSIRKWLAIPDGGLLWSKVSGIKNGGKEEVFEQVRLAAMRKKSAYLATGEGELKTEYREMLQFAAEALDKAADPYAISSFSEEILNEIDFKSILRIRQENVEVLKAALDTLRSQGTLAYITECPKASTLYFPILVKDRDRLQKYLAERNIYCPVIWPIPEESKGICEVAEYTALHMLALPCDQRYTTQDMRYIASVVTEALQNVN